MIIILIVMRVFYFSLKLCIKNHFLVTKLRQCSGHFYRLFNRTNPRPPTLTRGLRSVTCGWPPCTSPSGISRRRASIRKGPYQCTSGSSWRTPRISGLPMASVRLVTKPVVHLPMCSHFQAVSYRFKEQIVIILMGVGSGLIYLFPACFTLSSFFLYCFFVSSHSCMCWVQHSCISFTFFIVRMTGTRYLHSAMTKNNYRAGAVIVNSKLKICFAARYSAGGWG